MTVARGGGFGGGGSCRKSGRSHMCPPDLCGHVCTADLSVARLGHTPSPSLPYGASMRPGCLVCKLLATPSPAFLTSEKHTTLKIVLAEEGSKNSDKVTLQKDRGSSGLSDLIMG